MILKRSRQLYNIYQHLRFFQIFRRDLFDTSKQKDIDRSLQTGKDENVIGLMKDELDVKK